MKHWLERPYPLLESTKQKLLLAISFGVFVFIFLVVFRPFGANEIAENKTLFLAGFGLCVFTGLFINYIINPLVFPKIFDVERWQIKKEIIYLLSSFAIIAVLNYAYNSHVGDEIAPQRSLLEFLGITTSIGMFPVVILIFLVERNLNKKNTEKAEELSKSIQNFQKINTGEAFVKIVSESLKEPPLEIEIGNFIFATSDNNYTTVFYLNDGHLSKKLLRLSITNLEDQLTGFENIIRCHRSYLVNKNKIAKVKGNARSLIVRLAHYDQDIPVSRSFPKDRLI